MIDPDLLKEHSFRKIQENLEKRQFPPHEDLLKSVQERKDLISELEENQNKRNILSKKIGNISTSLGETTLPRHITTPYHRPEQASGRQAQATGQKGKKEEEIKRLREQVHQISERIDKIKEKQLVAERVYLDEILSLPNILDGSVPYGEGSQDNIVIERSGESPEFKFKPLTHHEIAKKLNLIDFERGVKLSGSRFHIFNHQLASLERNLNDLMLLHHSKRGYHERSVPFLVKEDCMLNTGQFPKFKDEYYHIGLERLSLIPTAEVPLTNIYADEILSEDDLPISLTSLTPCFRKEAGAAGKDTRGIIRVHQFHKVELVKFCLPEESERELDLLVSDVKSILDMFPITYRVVLLCSGDTGFAASKTFDFEVWFPASRRWVEISSCSNFKDFQARRAKIRYKDPKTRKNRLVHTLNGSALPSGRLIAALLEYYQDSQGNVLFENMNDLIREKKKQLLDSKTVY